jgi:hypothetical protein
MLDIPFPSLKKSQKDILHAIAIIGPSYGYQVYKNSFSFDKRGNYNYDIILFSFKNAVAIGFLESKRKILFRIRNVFLIISKRGFAGDVSTWYGVQIPPSVSLWPKLRCILPKISLDSSDFPLTTNISSCYQLSANSFPIRTLQLERSSSLLSCKAEACSFFASINESKSFLSETAEKRAGRSRVALTMPLVWRRFRLL